MVSAVAFSTLFFEKVDSQEDKTNDPIANNEAKPKRLNTGLLLIIFFRASLLIALGGWYIGSIII